MNLIANKINKLSLKEMEGSLLSFSIMELSSDAKHFNQTKIRESLELAAYLHRNKTRENRANLPKDTYITHPYRNTVRLLKYGVKYNEVIIASILHDTVEDHAFEIVNEFTDLDAHKLTLEQLMAESIIVYEKIFGKEIARLVNAVSNPPFPKTWTKAEKRKGYAVHVIDAIQDPKVFLIKVSDFVDNAVGLYHNTGRPEMVAHLSTKYLLVVDEFLTLVNNDTFAAKLNIPVEGINAIKEHLNMGKTRLQELSFK